MPSVILIDPEFDQLDGIPHQLRTLYVALRRRMDGATRMVGSPHPCSWQALREDVYVQPRPGIPGFSPSRFTLLRMAQGLARAGLVELRSNAAQHQLLMLLPLAPSFVRNKAAPNPHLKPHVPFHRGNPQKAARPTPPKAAPHLDSILPTVAANNSGDLATTEPVEKRTWQPTYPQGYSQREQRAILKVAHENHLSAVKLHELLDELCSYEGRNGACQNRTGFFIHMVTKQVKRGTFVGKGAEEIRSRGAPLTTEELHYTSEGNPHGP